MGKPAKKLDVHSTTSDVPGLYGFVESFMRRFRNFFFIAVLTPLLAVCIFCLGAALTPAIFIFQWVNEATAQWPTFSHTLALGLGAAFAYLVYGLSLVFIVPLVNFLLPLRVKPWRGIWFSLPAIPWYVHNALTYIVRYTFLEFITPTPLNILFYRMMGMKIGKGVVINTTNISDPSMIELGDFVTIGGSATLFAHYGQKGYLVIAPVKIGKGTTVGLKSSVMGDVEVGENVNILPHAALIPKTRVADGETFS
jgi:hypothetical protein